MNEPLHEGQGLAGAQESSEDNDYFSASQMHTLEKVLQNGLEDLLKKVIELDILDPPYGRPHVAKFKEEEDESDSSSDEDGETSSDESTVDLEDPKFKYDYGFNPLVYLGTYLKKNNPIFISQKQKEKENSLAYLQKRADHALRQQEIALQLQEQMVRLRSGIQQGPVCGGATADSIVFWAKTTKPGNLVVQVSDYEDFRYVTETAVVEVGPASDLAGQVAVGNLTPQQTYYYRACLHNPAQGYAGPDDGCFAGGRFSTLPDPGDYAEVRLAAVGQPLAHPGALLPCLRAGAAAEQGRLLAAVRAARPALVLLLGDPLPSAALGSLTRLGLPREQIVRVHRALFKNIHQTFAAHPLFKEVPVATAWNDTSFKAAMKLRKEEKEVQRRAEAGRNRKDRQRGAKNPSKEDEAPANLPLQVLLEQWPLTLGAGVAAGGALMTWREVQVNAHCHLFLLDTRGGALGKAQTEWLKHALVASDATWKLVAVGAPALGHEWARPRRPGRAEVLRLAGLAAPPPAAAADGGPAGARPKLQGQGSFETQATGSTSRLLGRGQGQRPGEADDASAGRIEEEEGAALGADQSCGDLGGGEAEQAAALRIQAVAKGRAGRQRAERKRARAQEAAAAKAGGGGQSEAAGGAAAVGLAGVAAHLAQRAVRGVVFLTGGGAYPCALRFDPEAAAAPGAPGPTPPLYELDCSPHLGAAGAAAAVPACPAGFRRARLLSLEGDPAGAAGAFGQVVVAAAGGLRFEVRAPGPPGGEGGGGGGGSVVLASLDLEPPGEEG